MAYRGAAQVAMVTGGRRGISRGIALAMAEAGFDIVLIDVQQDELGSGLNLTLGTLV